MARTKIYAHRGDKGNYPENTLLSFRKAVEEGVDGIELDVHLTKDNQLVIIHDETLERTTNGSGFVKNYTLSELQQFQANTADLQDFSDELHIPTLREVLELLKPYPTELNIELKTNEFTYEGIERLVLETVKRYGKGRKVVYSSFHLPSLIRIKAMDDSALIAWLVLQKIPHPVDYIETFNLEAIHLHYAIFLEDITYWKEVLPQLRLWTVNDEQVLKKIITLCPAAIITDLPDSALKMQNPKNDSLQCNNSLSKPYLL